MEKKRKTPYYNQALGPHHCRFNLSILHLGTETPRQGVCDGIINGPLVALMDDSCPAGRRSDVESMNASVGGEVVGR